MRGLSEHWRVAARHGWSLDDVDPSSTPGARGGRAETEAALSGLHAELRGLQGRLWAESRRSLLVVLQGLDTAGKDGTISHVFQCLNPQATRVTSFKVPTTGELAHDFLWRVHRSAPAAGEVGIFNRSHYEDVVAVRVHDLVPETVWRARYDLIVAFEDLLAHGGTTVVKCFLHISPDEQRRRLEDRMHEPDKRWKLRRADLVERAYWDDYQAAYTEALARTSTPAAPWYVIPADHKWYRNWAVTTLLVETLRALDPRYPDPEDPSLLEVPLTIRPVTGGAAVRVSPRRR